MKSMLIAASAIGAAVAGMIIYLRKPASGTKTLNDSPVKSELQYRSQHAMG